MLAAHMRMRKSLIVAHRQRSISGPLHANRHRWRIEITGPLKLICDLQRDAERQWIIADAQRRTEFFQLPGRDRFLSNRLLGGDG
jgi:hypothetical protein